MSSNDFGAQLRAFQAKVEANSRTIFVNTASAVKDSIVVGSPITGALGQPVDTGNLRNSWQLTFESPTLAEISTAVTYAPAVEDNVRGVTFKNHGPHSVKTTILSVDRLLEHETRKVVDAR